MMQPIKLQYYSPENDYYLLSVQSLLHLQALQYAHRLTAPNLVPRLLVGMEEKEPGISGGLLHAYMNSGYHAFFYAEIPSIVGAN